MSANAIFVIIFVFFCGFLLFAGLISRKWVKESSDFVLAGREISTPINIVGVIAIGLPELPSRWRRALRCSTD